MILDQEMSRKCKTSESNAIEIQSKAFTAAIHQAADFLVTRYPYLSLVLLMVSTPEEINDKKKPLPNFQFIYAQLGFYFAVGTLMSFNMLGLRRFSAALMAVQCAVTAYTEFNSSHHQVIMARLLLRNLASVGCYLMVAGGLESDNCKSDRNDRLLKIGRQIIGAYLVMIGVLMIHNKTEFSVHWYLLPGGGITVWVIIILYILCGLCIDYGILVVTCCKLAMFLIFFVTLIVDMDTDMWSKSVKVHKWKVYTIAAQHIPLIGVLMMFRDSYF